LLSANEKKNAMSEPKEDIQIISCSFRDNAEGLRRRINRSLARKYRMRCVG
jgi:hypothetical protein